MEFQNKLGSFPLVAFRFNSPALAFYNALGHGKTNSDALLGGILPFIEPVENIRKIIPVNPFTVIIDSDNGVK